MEKVWAGAVVAILAGGPSLDRGQMECCRGRAKVIAINSSIYSAPWADMLYFCDEKWYRWNQSAVRSFCGMIVTLENRHLSKELPGIICMADDSRKSGIRCGFCEDPGGLRTGGNSGYQALHLAAHMGARKVLLLGYDMKPAQDGRMHHYQEHPIPTDPASCRSWISRFDSLVVPLRGRGVEVVNCTPGSMIRCFPSGDVREAIV